MISSLSQANEYEELCINKILNKTMKVKYLDFGKIFKEYPDAAKAMLNTIESGDMIMRKELDEFEKKLALYTGTKYAVGVANGSDALFLSLKSLGIGEGDEVITVAHTFVATIQEIAHTGATPILVDVYDKTGLMNMNQVEKAITERTKAIIPVHLAGDWADMEALKHLGIPIIEDSCQALGAGSPSNIGVYSFYPAKLLGWVGDGGAIVTNDEGTYEELLKLRNHYNIGKATMGEGKAFAQSETYKFGYNSRLDNMAGAFLGKKIDTLDDDIRSRKRIAERYDDWFKELPIRLPVKRDVYQDYIIRTDKRDELYKHLKKYGIETLGADQLSPHRFPGLGLNKYKLPITDKHFKESLRLPCNQFMTLEDIDYVITIVRTFYREF